MFTEPQASPSRAALLVGGEQDGRDTLRVPRQLAGPAFNQDRVATRFTDTEGHPGAKLFFWRGC